MICQNQIVFARVISVGTSRRGLQVAYSLDKALVAGRSTQGELDKSCCRRWATNQAKVWGRTLKVGELKEAVFFLMFWAILCVVQKQHSRADIF